MLTGIGQMKLLDIPKPKLQHPNQVLLKIVTVGICGSDIHYYKKGKIGDQIVKYPFTTGHECTAIVEQVGNTISRVRTGDCVAIDPVIVCAKCAQCRSGRTHTCLNQSFLGCPGQVDGCLSEYIVMPQECCYVVKPEISFEQAAFTEPLSIGIYALRLLEATVPQKIGILGMGPIGLSVLMALKDQKDHKIYASDKIDRRLTVAKSIGANWTGNPVNLNIESEIQNQEPDMLDAVFECCGDQDALDQAIELLKPGGKLLIVGIPDVNRISFDINRLRRKEIRIQNVRRQNRCMESAIELVERNSRKISSLITHVFPFEKTRDAFELVSEYRDGVVKAIIDLS